MKRIPMFYLLALLVALLGACSTMQNTTVTVPNTPQETIYSLRMQFAALVNTAADMRQAGAVTDDMYQRLDSVFQRARSAFGLADTALLQGVSAEDQIEVIRRLMLEVRQLLGTEPDTK